MITIYQVVPRLPPVMDGIGDYSFQLARTLRENHDIDSKFIVGDPSWQGSTELEGFSVQKVHERSALALMNLLVTDGSPDTVLIHYNGYGYHPRGIPFWLINGLKLWQRNDALGNAFNSSYRLFTLFHDLWASGPLWSSTFFLHLPQRWIAQRLLHLSQGSVTSTVRMKQLLEQGNSKLVDILPISSNIPFTLKLDHRKERRQVPFRVLIFGRLGSRMLTIKAHRQLLAELVRRRILEQVIVVGKGSEAGEMNSIDVQALLNAVPAAKIKVLGEIEPMEVANQFAQADFYLSFSDAYLACKSTCLMAALACGCPAVLREGLNSEPLQAEKHFLTCDGSIESVNNFLQNVENGALETVGITGQQWYRKTADWKLIASKWQEILTESCC